MTLEPQEIPPSHRDVRLPKKDLTVARLRELDVAMPLGSINRGLPLQKMVTTLLAVALFIANWKRAKG
jgi:hypothetical protein